MNLSTKPTKVYSKREEKKSKITYYSKLLHKYRTASKWTWQVMKEITRIQKTKSNLLPQEIIVDKSIIQNPQDIAEEFNKYFTSVGPKLARKIPNTEKVLW